MVDDWNALFEQAMREQDSLKWKAALWELYWRDRPRAVEQLLDLVLTGQSEERMRAAEALGLIADRGIAVRLLPALKTGDNDLKVAALRALTLISDLTMADVFVPGDYRSMQMFADLFRSTSYDVRATAAALLARVGDVTLI